MSETTPSINPLTCEHDWAHEHKFTPSFPPVQRKICVLCLTLEHERGLTPDLSTRFDTALAAKEASNA